jgi:hypothetical protein
MPSPKVIPIKRHAGYHTDSVGRYADGQFLGCITGPHTRLLAADGQLERRQRWYAVLHRFDHDGHHIGSDIRFTGTTAEGREASVTQAAHILRKWLAELSDVVYGDIAIRPFRTMVDDIDFGLIDVSDEHGDHLELVPNHLGFYPPWDGTYDT